MNNKEIAPVNPSKKKKLRSDFKRSAVNDEVEGTHADALNAISGKGKKKMLNPEPKKMEILSWEKEEKILKTLKERFNNIDFEIKNQYFEEVHKRISWEKVEDILRENVEALWSINEMEKAGHEPDIYHADSKGFYIGTCSFKPPQRNCTYNEAVEMANAMGIKLMTPEQYEHLRCRSCIDCTYTESWLKTPKQIRNKGKGICGNNIYIYNYDWDHYSEYRLSGRDESLGWRGFLKVLWKKEEE